MTGWRGHALTKGASMKMICSGRLVSTRCCTGSLNMIRAHITAVIASWQPTMENTLKQKPHLPQQGQTPHQKLSSEGPEGCQTSIRAVLSSKGMLWTPQHAHGVLDTNSLGLRI